MLENPRDDARWPMPEHPTQYVDQGSTIRDDVTGLVWQAVASTSYLEWEQAGPHCDALVLAGETDWRVPTRIELLSLLEFGRSPMANTVLFPDIAADFYWSSSYVAMQPEKRWMVDFADAYTEATDMRAQLGLVRCVRGGAEPALPHYTVDNETVVDNWTGLTWRRAVSPPMTFEAASNYCVNGWRIPTMKELWTTVRIARASPAIDTSVFFYEPDAGLWSSTASTEPGRMRTLVERDGTTMLNFTAAILNVRCVRN